MKVKTEVLEHYVEYFNKQEGKPHPCSNQIVVCGVITLDRNKALLAMKEKGATIRRTEGGWYAPGDKSCPILVDK